MLECGDCDSDHGNNMGQFECWGCRTASLALPCQTSVLVGQADELRGQ